ncbi:MULTISPECIES: hypothetical protein [unclassified Gilliamella]|uniref:hypothetical protein n=1 Tax=unclassified Gilliamella TaxID=2685620 RepID=UPI0018DCDE08|nr:MULTISPECIES: hypothetical protein [unclassified Gilliamella]MBI0115003.1 hypothetical protein [Gilliamella sp. W8123]MBI0118720.1 hypothetical protein [Gilliamella sp. W8129]
MVLVLTVVVLQSISFANYALTTKTTNIIYGSAPYLTFDGGRTRVTNTEALLGISLSDGRTFTPTTNNSERNPIVLPVAGQSFNDIGMLVPTDTDSIALSSLIGTPYNYWGDDDGDGQGIDGITATGSLNLSIVDNFNHPVARNEVLTICKAPYKLTLSNDGGRLTTRYGVPNESRFTAGNATYYINPKASPVICYARPDLGYRDIRQGLSADIWNPEKGFLPQSVTPSSYGLNFPTTGANNLYFYLDIGGSNQALSWAPVSHGGITATMTDSTSTSVKVTLTGPIPTEWQQQTDYPDPIDRPSLPQTFELVGRDSSGNAVVKYGFELKQWFVHRGNYESWDGIISWCDRYHIGYRNPKVLDLTNASCQGRGSSHGCRGAVGATPSSPDNNYRRHIGAGFFTEWGRVDSYANAGFKDVYLTQDWGGNNLGFFVVRMGGGTHCTRASNYCVNADSTAYVVCVYP